MFYGGDKHPASVLMGWCGTLWAVLSLVGVFPMIYIATRLGKSKTVMVFLIVNGGWKFTQSCLFTAGHIPGLHLSRQRLYRSAFCAVLA